MVSTKEFHLQCHSTDLCLGVLNRRNSRRRGAGLSCGHLAFELNVPGMEMCKDETITSRLTAAERFIGPWVIVLQSFKSKKVAYGFNDDLLQARVTSVPRRRLRRA